MGKKRPEYKIQLALATLLLFGSSLAYWFEYTKKPKDDAATETAKKPIELSGIEISTIELSNEERKIVLSCLDREKNLCKPGDNTHWEITSPIRFKADDSVVNSLVSNLNNLRPATTVDLSTDTPEKRSQLITNYKLDSTARLRKDAKSVKITAKDGTVTRLHFGDKHPIEDGFFALTELKGVAQDKRVYVIPTFQITSLDQPLSAFRNKQMLSLNQSDVSEVQIKDGKNSATPILVKKEGANWTVALQGAPSVPGDNDSIEAEISGALFLNAKSFAEDSKTSPAGKTLLASSKKRLEIKLKTTAGTEETLTLFEKKFKDAKNTASLAYAVVSSMDPVYQVETTAIERLDRGYNELRLMRLIPTMARFDLKWIEVEGKGFTQTIEKSDKGWKLTKGILAPSRVDALLERLTSNSIQTVLPQSIPAVEPKVRVSFGPAAANRKFEFTFFRQNGRTLAIDEISSHKDTYVLREDLVGLIPWDEKAWIASTNTDKAKTDGHH